MTTEAHHTTVRAHVHDTVATDIRAGVGFPTPEPESPAAHERIDPRTCEVVPPPTYKPTDVTDWTPQEVDDLIDADERELEAWKASTVPAPPKVVGLDGKTYARPEPKAAEPARRAALPPRRTPNRPADLELASTTGMQQGHPPEPTPMGAPAWLLFG